MTPVALSFENRVYKIEPDIALVCDIEEEMGPVPLLQQKFSGPHWSVAELVSLVQMMLHAQGRTVDYRILGDRMLQEGLKNYLNAVRRLLSGVISREICASENGGDASHI